MGEPDAKKRAALAGTITMPRDLWLLGYRQEMGLGWGDLTGQWPQPAWRTEQDLWYATLAAEAAQILAERARKAAPPGEENASI